MRKSQLSLVTAASFAVLFLSVSIAFAANVQVVKAGKKGDVTFNQPTQVGNVTLPPGRYVVQHRDTGTDHYVKFVGSKEMQHTGTAMTATMQMGPTTSEEIKCTVEPVAQKVQHTAVTISTEAGVRRVTRIEIAGENVAHVF